MSGFLSTGADVHSLSDKAELCIPLAQTKNYCREAQCKSRALLRDQGYNLFTSLLFINCTRIQFIY